MSKNTIWCLEGSFLTHFQLAPRIFMAALEDAAFTPRQLTDYSPKRTL